MTTRFPGAGLESMLTATGSYYYLADGLGSTMAMVDSTGKVAKSYTYDVYGKPTATGALPNEYDFAGQQSDPTGLQYLRARYMDPETGTFVSREPLAQVPVWIGHPFGYARSYPIGANDPTGLWPVDGDNATSDCQSGSCTSYGPLYDYGYPDVEATWTDGGIDYGALWEKSKYVGNPAAWAADALNVLAKVDPKYLRGYQVATIIAALWAAAERDYATALLALATISAGPEFIVPLILLNELIHDFIDPPPAGDPCDYDTLADRCRDASTGVVSSLVGEKATGGR
ncbi:MAG: hypothetical protein L6Q80_14840 [Dehalococcoidia bacterium]|nr:hypothetical protein [Dehalococcoidia bacterium]